MVRVFAPPHRAAADPRTQRVLAIKRFTRALVNFLTRQGRCLTGRARSIDLARPTRSCVPAVRRADRKTGSRVSSGMICSSARGPPARHCNGRKERCTSFAKSTTTGKARHCASSGAHDDHWPPTGRRRSRRYPLWLGHESVEPTQMYLEATLAMKEPALIKTPPYSGKSSR